MTNFVIWSIVICSRTEGAAAVGGYPHPGDRADDAEGHGGGEEGAGCSPSSASPRRSCARPACQPGPPRRPSPRRDRIYERSLKGPLPGFNATLSFQSDALTHAEQRCTAFSYPNESY